MEPKKKPRAAYRRFVYPAPNACWQLDGTEYVLTGGRTCVIFQLIDDHSRLAIGSHVAWGETAEGAIIVVDKAIAAHGVPQRLLSDNGVALNPSRRGFIGQLVAHVSALGVEVITGKPYQPTTQGKNERFHQTLFRYLDKQSIADTLANTMTGMSAQGIEARVANALFSTANGSALWVGGRVTLTATGVQFKPNMMNELVHMPLGGVESAPVDLQHIRTITVGNELFTKVVTIDHDGGKLTFRCYGAVAFAKRIRDAVAANRPRA